MPSIPKQIVEKAREMDLFTYLSYADPGELVHCRGDTYCTRTHDSLKIRRGMWYWFSRGIGGYTALDYLIKVKNYSFPEAVQELTGERLHDVKLAVIETAPKKELVLPEPYKDTERVKQYLIGRGIHPGVIAYCIDHGLLYESKDYHNAVFVGYDANGKARYAAIRSTVGSFKRDATGSSKRFPFLVTESQEATQLHLFEAAVDLLSYATLCELKGLEWKNKALLSLAGVYIKSRKGDLPIALSQYLRDHPDTNEVFLHLDNDEVGRLASAEIGRVLATHYVVRDEPPPYGKDVNDYLMYKLRIKEQEKGSIDR